MVDFRKGLLLLAGMVVTTGLASAQALSPVSCTVIAGSNPIIRGEGVAEPVGQVYLDCSGGTTVADGSAVPTVNITVVYSAPVTSRLLVPSTSASEALLVIDTPSAENVIPCMAGSTCSTTAGTSLPNVYQALQMTNGFTWNGVAINPPGTTGHRYIRVLNARVNATSISGAITAQVLVTSNNTSTSPVSVTSSPVSVGFPTPGLTVSADADTTPSLSQCGSSAVSFTVNFKEGFGAAFRVRAQAGGVAATWYTADFTSESTVSYPLSGDLANAGVASTGTRLIANFANIPTNVSLSVPTTLKISGTTVATLVTSANAFGVGGTLATSADPVTLTSTNGTAFAVYEVTASDPTAISTVPLIVTASIAEDTTPGLGTITVTGGFGPTTGGTSTAAPRFAPSSATPFNGIAVNPCTTSLLFPFVTNDAGFDTGIAIANTSSDPNGSAAQAGTVTFYYYGTDAPDAQTSASVAAGSVLSFSLSGGIDGTAVAGAPGFTGYMIAKCNFRLAHGYAFISDAGAQKLAQGYLALVLPEGARSTASPEALNQ